MNENDPIAVWLKTVQGVDLGDRQTISAQRSGDTIAKVIESAGGGRRFDAEPAQHAQLLRRLAPGLLSGD